MLALERGLRVRAAVVAGTASSALTWTAEDERRRSATVEALRGRQKSTTTSAHLWASSAPSVRAFRRAPVVRVPGDHVTAVLAPEFADALVAVVRATS